MKKSEENRIKGMVFDIQHFSLHDGPGIRTALFLKGCELNCTWCHNPEGQNRNPELLFYKDKCARCARCVEACNLKCHEIEDGLHIFHRERCRGCGICVEMCASGAIKQAGKVMSIADIFRTLEPERPFYGKDGGITITGGEPMTQPEFVLALLKAAKTRNIHTCLETCGHCDKKPLLDVIPFTNLILFDVKETDPALHKLFTGVNNEIILENLAALAKAGTDVVLRCPLIGGCNARNEHALEIARLANGYHNIIAIHILPYHPFGLSKYKALGRACAYADESNLDESFSKAFCLFLREHTTVPVMLL